MEVEGGGLQEDIDRQDEGLSEVAGREEDHISPTNSTGAVLLPTLTLLPSFPPSLSFSVYTLFADGGRKRATNLF